MSKIKHLIILDLNGLLIHRVHKSVYVKCKGLLEEQYSLGNLSRPERKGNFAVWFRPNVREFLKWLMDHFHVAIWSSVLLHNIAPIVESLLPSQNQRSRLLFWWNQEHCHTEEDPDAKDPTNTKVFFKRLTSVWDDVDVNERWLVGQPKHLDLRDYTLLIDDNKSKVRDNPIHTSLHPRSWKLFELNDDNSDLKIYKDNVLEKNGSLMKWLEALSKWNGSVPEYVEKHPYVDPPLEEVEKQVATSWNSDWD